MSPIGSRLKSRASHAQASHGFTLIELILVMALLLIVLGVSAPQLQRFFKGRNLDSEARRFLSLTVYGQSRAVSEGIPMLLWIDAKQRSYGLRAASGFLQVDTKALEFQLDPNLRVELTLPRPGTTFQPVIADQVMGTLPSIQFTPDGFIGESSPDQIFLIQEDRGTKADGDIVAVVQSTNRLRYELQSINEANPRGAR